VRRKDAVAGRGHERHIAGVDEASRQNRQRGLGADAVDNLRVGVDAGDVADVVHPARRRLLERCAAVVGVNAILRLSRGGSQGSHAIGEGHFVGFADAQVDQLCSRMGGQCGALGPLDLLEFVDGRAFAVANAADALGEEILDVGVHSGAVSLVEVP
jgi:hypothetical protein